MTMATALVVLAAIEAALALTRDEISRLERELMATLAGAQPDARDTPSARSRATLRPRSASSFPFALAFLGFAIEASDPRTAASWPQLVIGALLQVASFLVRLLRQLVLGLLAVLLALYDFAIFLPLFIERKWREARSSSRLARRNLLLGAGATALVGAADGLRGASRRRGIDLCSARRVGQLFPRARQGGARAARHDGLRACL